MSEARAASPWRRLRHSLRVRLVLLFLLLALAMSVAFIGGVGKALSAGWRGATEPLFVDYADRLVDELGTPPSIARAQALAERLPLAVRISGPAVNWVSGPWPRHGPPWARAEEEGGAGASAMRARNTVSRQTADGHRVEFSLKTWRADDDKKNFVWFTLAALLALTALAYGVVHRMLRPIRDIGEGVRRFGAGQFEPPIRVRQGAHADELSDLAHSVNRMAADIHQMLDAKRDLLLAISHELRTPLTRARLNAELLAEDADTAPTRAALLRDLAQMRDLITDLLESERLASRHAALQREATDLPALAHALIGDMAALRAAAADVPVHVAPSLTAPLWLDAGRTRLLLRNLLDNALRHTPTGAAPPELHLGVADNGHVLIEVRDHGPGVPPEQLARLTEAFYRPDDARQRSTGGVGLGLYLARMVAEAHGGRLTVRNAQPGLAVRAEWPAAAVPAES